MVITFCGHREIFNENNLINKITNILNLKIKENDVTFYLGGYGKFDSIAKLCCLKYKQLHPKSKIYFVSPYLDSTYLNNKNSFTKSLDGTIFPELEKVPKKFAILERNKWMVIKSDLIISYINYSWGGATKTYEYAKTKKKFIINLGTYS